MAKEKNDIAGKQYTDLFGITLKYTDENKGSADEIALCEKLDNGQAQVICILPKNKREYRDLMTPIIIQWGFTNDPKMMVHENPVVVMFFSENIMNPAKEAKFLAFVRHHVAQRQEAIRKAQQFKKNGKL